MMNFIWSLNRWFDNIGEPNRFIIFLAFIALPVFLTLIIHPLVFFMLAALVGGTRAYWIHRASKHYGK